MTEPRLEGARVGDTRPLVALAGAVAVPALTVRVTESLRCLTAEVEIDLPALAVSVTERLRCWDGVRLAGAGLVTGAVLVTERLQCRDRIVRVRRVRPRL